jgi:dTDP-4-amino-4,6-dideoxygalactose transaminase
MKLAASGAASLPEVTSASAFPKWPEYSEEQIAAVAAILRSGQVNYWTGTQAREFEKEYAQAVGVRHAIALANGTVTLELALTMLGVGVGDEVITTPRTFIASASCIALQGAKPVFADIDRDSQNLTARSIEQAITSRTKAIVLVHLAGWPCDMGPILELANTHGIAVVEDCAQAHGAKYKGAAVGSFGTFGSFSFCQDKIITTGGEGGLLVTDNEELWRRAWSYKDHGKSYEAVYRRAHGPGFRWLHESFGTNWRMTEIQAVLGRMQLRQLSESVVLRRRNASMLIDGLRGISCLRIPVPPADAYHAYYKFYVFLDPSQIGRAWTRDRVVSEVVARGVPCFAGSCSEIYLEKAFDGHDSRPPVRLQNAQELGETSLTFLVHPTLSQAHMTRTVEVVRDVLQLARGNS